MNNNYLYSDIYYYNFILFNIIYIEISLMLRAHWLESTRLDMRGITKIQQKSTGIIFTTYHSNCITSSTNKYSLTLRFTANKVQLSITSETVVLLMFIYLSLTFIILACLLWYRHLATGSWDINIFCGVNWFNVTESTLGIVIESHYISLQ